uniref:HT-protein n=1 Tax=Solanum peruvianum TaxID=4082 RepID=Q8LP78_SOLPE|nr:HT-protein [Solanum peruvianum]
MAFNANILLIFSLVLMIISSEVIARDIVEPSLPLLEANEIHNTELNNPTLQKKGGGKWPGWIFDAACSRCTCPSKDNKNNNNNNNNNNDDDDFITNVCKAACC